MFTIKLICIDPDKKIQKYYGTIESNYDIFEINEIYKMAVNDLGFDLINDHCKKNNTIPFKMALRLSKIKKISNVFLYLISSNLSDDDGVIIDSVDWVHIFLWIIKHYNPNFEYHGIPQKETNNFFDIGGFGTFNY